MCVYVCVCVCRLHAQLDEDEEAAKLYTRFVATVATSEVWVWSVCVYVWSVHFVPQAGSQLPDEEGPAHLYLAKYNLKLGSYKEAEAHAHKATEYDTVRHSHTPSHHTHFLPV